MLLDTTAVTHSEVERLADIIMSLQRCFVQRLSEQLVHGQVSFAQFFLLCHIDAHESLSMTEIAEKMSHSTAAATGLVDRLQNLGYLQRGHAPTDRRKVMVKITPKGSELVQMIRGDIVNNLGSIMDQLSPAEQKMWVQIYDKIHSFCQTKPNTCKE